MKGQQPLLKWSASIPPILGGFPADALLFRKGYVKQGEAVVHEERTLKSLWARETPLIAEDPSFDPNRDKAQPGRPPGEKATEVNPLAFLVGPVEVKYDGDPSKTRVDRPLPLHRPRQEDDPERHRRNPARLQHRPLHRRRPQAQGACGFLEKAGLIKLSDLSIRSANAYATVVAVSLDDLPLATSKRILIQIGTAAQAHRLGHQARRIQGRGEKARPRAGGRHHRQAPLEDRQRRVRPLAQEHRPHQGHPARPRRMAAEVVAVTKVRTGITLTPPVTRCT